MEKLENGVKSLLESDKYKEYLTFLSKFHNYREFFNILYYKPMFVSQSALR